MVEAGKALGVAHAAGLTHRDVKSENLLVDQAGRIRVTDFGLVTGEDLSRLTRSGAWVGTPNAMAPEQFGARERIGPPSDVWALGILLYRALTGGYPFEAPTMLELASAITRGVFTRPSRVASVSPALEAVCLKALEPDVAARYPDGASFAAALELAAQDRSRGASRARPWFALLALIALVVVLGLGLRSHAQDEAAARVRAEEALSSLLAPAEGASARFADLGPRLGPLREAIGSDTGPLLFAAGLSAVGEDKEDSARQVLERLRALPSEGSRAAVLQASCDARWSKSSSDLRATSRRLSSPSVSTSLGGFADYQLLLGRALTLSGDPVQGLEAMTRAPHALRDEPWRSLALRAAALAGAKGRFEPATLQALVAALPKDEEALLALRDWAQLLRKPAIPRLAELLERGQVPAEFRAPLRAFAERELGVARVPYRPEGTPAAAGGGYWGKAVLGLRIRVELPLPAQVYEVLADWTLVAAEFRLERVEQLHEVVRAALRAMAPQTTREHLRQRQRLFEAYLRVAPTAAEIGAYGLAAIHMDQDQGRRARETLQKLSAGAPEPQRGFWELWLTYLEVLHGVYRFPAPSMAERSALRSKLSGLEDWALEADRDPATLAALAADPAVREVFTSHGDLPALVWLSLARASVASEEPLLSLDYFARVKSRKAPGEGWNLEYITALLTAYNSPSTSSAARAEVKATFVGEVRDALGRAHPDFLFGVLRTAWDGRSLLPLDEYEGVLEESRRLALSGARGSVRFRVSAAWFALGLGRESAARQWLQEAAALRSLDARARRIQEVSSGELTQDKIVALDESLIIRAQPIRNE